MPVPPLPPLPNAKNHACLFLFVLSGYSFFAPFRLASAESPCARFSMNKFLIYSNIASITRPLFI